VIPTRNAALLCLEVPERGELAVPLAGLGRRAVAGIIDLTLLAAVAVALLGVVAVIVPMATLAGPVSFAVLAIVPTVGPLALELIGRGQSPGKRLLGLRVVGRDGAPAGAGQLFLRNVMRLVDFLPFGYFVGLAVMLVSRHGQRVGDLVGGTVVAREDPGALADVDDEPPVVPSRGELGPLPLHLALAARRLLEPEPRLDPFALLEREREVTAALRRLRPELAGATDRQLWALLERALGGDS
jgi:uncharacterized RDD family membrane protein YckC